MPIDPITLATTPPQQEAFAEFYKAYVAAQQDKPPKRGDRDNSTQGCGETPTPRREPREPKQTSAAQQDKPPRRGDSLGGSGCGEAKTPR